MSVCLSAPRARRGTPPVDRVLLRRRARRALGALDHACSELSLSLVPDDEMTQLNAAHRGIAAPTDVLSFSLLEGAAAAHRGALLGDVVIALGVAQRQARRGRRSLDDELARLLIHGVLHLVGHDHARPHEALAMRREERRLWRTVCGESDGATRGGVTRTSAGCDGSRGDERRCAARAAACGAHVSAARRVSLLAAYALVTFLSFPHPLAGGVLDLGWCLAFVGPAPRTRARRPRAAPRCGVAFLGGLAGQSLVLHWIFVVTVVYGGVPFVVGLLAPIGLAAYTALHLGLFGWVAARLARRRLDGPLLLAAAFTTQEWLRHHVFTGFPWGVLGYAQHENPLLMALASLGGVHALSLVTALFSFGALTLLRDRAAGRRPTPSGVAALLLVLGAHGVGAFVLASETPPAGGTLRVAVLQGNVSQDVKWSEDFSEETMQRYERLTREAAARGAEAIVWPETAVPGSIDLDAGLRDRLQRLAEQAQATLVVGAVGIEGRGREARYFDSGFVLLPDGSISDRYDKAHLVPFGEYVPFVDWIGGVVQALARGIAPASVTAGAGPRVVAIERPARSALPEAAVVPVGVTVCYELLFPDLMRRFVRAGAAVLFAITNDAWYGRTGAPYQFLAITALRAAETRTWVARAAIPACPR